MSEAKEWHESREWHEYRSHLLIAVDGLFVWDPVVRSALVVALGKVSVLVLLLSAA